MKTINLESCLLNLNIISLELLIHQLKFNEGKPGIIKYKNKPLTKIPESINYPQLIEEIVEKSRLGTYISKNSEYKNIY